MIIENKPQQPPSNKKPTTAITDLSAFKRSPHLPWIYGDGIKKGVAGRPVTFTVDMRYTRPGHITCTCRTPGGKE